MIPAAAHPHSRVAVPCTNFENLCTSVSRPAGRCASTNFSRASDERVSCGSSDLNLVPLGQQARNNSGLL